MSLSNSSSCTSSCSSSSLSVLNLASPTSTASPSTRAMSSKSLSMPMSAPIASPLASPMSAPIASPLASPMSAPIASPLASPVKVAKTANALHRILVQNQIGTKLIAEIIGIAIDPEISSNRYVLTLWDAQCVALALAGGKLQSLLDSCKVQKGFALRVDDYTIETRSTGMKLLHIDDAQVLPRGQFRTLPGQVETKKVLFAHRLLDDYMSPSFNSASACCDVSKPSESQPSRPLKRSRTQDKEGDKEGDGKSKNARKEACHHVNFDVLASIGPGPCQRTLVVKLLSVSLKELRSKKNGSCLKKLDIVAMDGMGNQMLAFAWGDVADKLQATLEPNKIYALEKGTYDLVPKNPDFNHLDHPYEIKLSYRTRFADRDAELAQMFESVKERIDLADVVPLSGLSKLDDKSEVNVLALVMARNQLEDHIGLKQNVLRKLVLNDEDGVTCELTLWNSDANAPWVLDPELEGSVIALKRAEVRLFKGGESVSLTKGFKTRVVVNPDLPEAKKLKEALLDPSFKLPEMSPAVEMTISQFRALREEPQMSQSKRLRLLAVITNIDRNQPWILMHCPHCNYHSASERDLSLPPVLPSISSSISQASQAPEVSQVSAPSTICLQCQKTVQKPKFLLVPCVEVSDHTGTESLKLRHSTAIQLLRDSISDSVSVSNSNRNRNSEKGGFNIVEFQSKSSEEQLALLSRLEFKMYEFLIEVQSRNKFLRLSVVSAKKVNASSL